MTSVAAGVILVLLSAAPGAVGAQNSTGGQGSTSASSSSQGSDQKDAPPKKPGPKEKPYGLIFGTAYGPDDHPIYGVHVTIHPEGHKKPSWELMSDHRGEFAQRVPPGPGDYVITGEVEIKPLVDGKPQKKKRLKGEAKVHLAGEEEQDFSLHMNE
jgi:hypothetical protein